MTDINSWAAVDDSNNSTPPAGWPEGQMPSTVNNTARAMMGALKRWRDQAQPTVTATGTGNAQIVTYPVAPAALASGDVFAFFALANTGPVTLQVNAQAAKPVRTSIGTALIGGEMPAGAVVMVVYDGTNFRMLAAPTPLSISNGGTGQTTPGAAADAIGAVKDTGDTMTGTLTVPSIVYSGNPYGHGFSFGWDGSATHVYVDGTDIGTIGDITSVSAGNGLTGGGTSGALTLSMSGSYTGNFTATGNFTSSGGGLTVASNINSTGGSVDCAYLHSRGACDIVGNLGVGGDQSVSGNINCNSFHSNTSVDAGGHIQTSGGQMYMGDGGAGRIMQMGSGWYWEWNNSNGDMIWGGPSGAQFWVIRYSDRYCGNQIGPVFGFGAYINASDARGKTDITPVSQGLAEIMRLEPVRFRRIRQEGDPESRVELGFLAQDVRGVLPEAVYPMDAGADPTLGVSLDPIVASLVNAVQQLAARVEELEAR
jgi:hypothetical protein